MSKGFLIILTFILGANASAQTIILEEDFSNGIPATWAVIDQDGLTVDSSLSAFSDGWIGYIDGTDTCAATTSFFQDTIADAEDYLILPKLSLLTFSKFSWDARSVDASFTEGYHILVSTTDSNITSFTDTLLTVDAEYFDWDRRTLVLDTMGYANQDIFIAFAHHSQNGFILEVDNVRVEVSDFASEEELILEEEIDLYPNPATQYLTIAADKYAYTTIHAISGRMLLQSNKKVIDVSELAPGQYYAIIRTENGSHSKGFVKN